MARGRRTGQARIHAECAADRRRGEEGQGTDDGDTGDRRCSNRGEPPSVEPLELEPGQILVERGDLSAQRLERRDLVAVLSTEPVSLGRAATPVREIATPGNIAQPSGRSAGSAHVAPSPELRSRASESVI